MGRAASQILEQLLESMQVLVRSYHPEVRKTGSTIPELVPGTAFFSRRLRSLERCRPFGMLPDLFPDAPVMFVAHNFDSISAYEKCKRIGGEAHSFFWRTLLAYLSQASIRPERCFFTNALRGLKPGSAVGPMPAVPGYHDECQIFLGRQIEIVGPSLVVALGQKARTRVSNLQTTVASVGLLHPSARELKPLTTRSRKNSMTALAGTDCSTKM
jgi:hypothetical protein